MQIVTDRGSDLSTQQMQGLEIHVAPMKLTLDGKTYSSGVDLSSGEFYDLLEKTEGYPTTSQPSVGDFVELYRELAKVDPNILSVHISSGLSGTLDSARAAAAMVPEAIVTFWDTLTLSSPEGWQVEAAARAVKAGWTLDQVLAMLEKLRANTMGIFTLDTLKYLIHGGRINHLTGLVASLLHIRPVIGVEKQFGKYITLGQERTMKRALQKLGQVVAGTYGEGAHLRVQILHGKNPGGVAQMQEIISQAFQCDWLPTVNVAPILGAHTGGSLIGLCAAPADLYTSLP
jgi:DegV family protein with EDD domain